MFSAGMWAVCGALKASETLAPASHLTLEGSHFCGLLFLPLSLPRLPLALPLPASSRPLRSVIPVTLVT